MEIGDKGSFKPQTSSFKETSSINQTSARRPSRFGVLDFCVSMKLEI
jgi:hypothetical protein